MLNLRFSGLLITLLFAALFSFAGCGGAAGEASTDSGLSARPSLDFDGNPGNPTIDVLKQEVTACNEHLQNPAEPGDSKYFEQADDCQRPCAAYVGMDNFPFDPEAKPKILALIAELCDAEGGHATDACYTRWDTGCEEFTDMGQEHTI